MMAVRLTMDDGEVLVVDMPDQMMAEHFIAYIPLAQAYGLEQFIRIRKAIIIRPEYSQET